jgi:hypothetical protein
MKILQKTNTFGMLMPGRQFSNGTGYRFGFNGQEHDNDINGKGNLNTATFWEYDTRLGRRWNVDPVVKPWESPFLTFGGNPILNSDVNGDDFKDKNGHRVTAGENIVSSSCGNYIYNNNEDGNWKYKVWDEGSNTYLDPKFEVKPDECSNETWTDTKHEDRNQSQKEWNNFVWQNANKNGYLPYIPKSPDAVGVNFSGAFIFGGGATGEISLGWLRTEGFFVSNTVGGGVGFDAGIGSVSVFAAYNQNPEQLNMAGYSGDDWETGGQYGLGFSWSGDISKDKNTGKTVIGKNWKTYEFSVGAEVSGYSKVNHTAGISFVQLVKYWQSKK